MIQNKVVVHYQNGKIIKGTTNDFLPAKPTFHFMLNEAPAGTAPVEVQVSTLKAIFFVKNFQGNPDHEDIKMFMPDRTYTGRKMSVLFKDGETLMGTTQGYDPNRPGFFLVPADHLSNNIRCFVVISATQKISFL
jgi:small nuclear ribonucleoprotein (snRNP)-like protein